MTVPEHQPSSFHDIPFETYEGNRHCVEGDLDEVFSVGQRLRTSDEPVKRAWGHIFLARFFEAYPEDNPKVDAALDHLEESRFLFLKTGDYQAAAAAAYKRGQIFWHEKQDKPRAVECFERVTAYLEFARERDPSYTSSCLDLMGLDPVEFALADRTRSHLSRLRQEVVEGVDLADRRLDPPDTRAH